MKTRTKKLAALAVAVCLTAGLAYGRIFERVVALFADGTAAAPALAFVSQPSSGVYKAATSTVGIAGGGSAAATFTPGTMALKKSTGANIITSDTSATAMTSAVPAVRVSPTATPDTNDMLFEVMYGTTSVLSVDKEGDLTIAGAFTFTPADVTLSGGDLTSSHATQAFNFVADTNAATATASVAPFSFAPSATLDANDLVCNFKGVVAGSSVFSVDLEGDGVLAGDLALAGNGLTCSGTGATCAIGSGANDGVTSATNGAFTMAATVNVTDGDLILNVENSAGDNLFTVNEQGAVTALTSLNATTTLSVGGGTAVAKITSEQVDNQDIGSAAAGAISVLAVSVAGATLGDSVICQPVQDDAAFDTGSLTCFVESAGVVKLVYQGGSAGGDPAATNDYRFTILRF